MEYQIQDSQYATHGYQQYYDPQLMQNNYSLNMYPQMQQMNLYQPIQPMTMYQPIQPMLYPPMPVNLDQSILMRPILSLSQWRQRNQLQHQEQPQLETTYELEQTPVAGFGATNVDLESYENWASTVVSEPTTSNKRPLEEDAPLIEPKKMKHSTDLNSMSRFEKLHCCGKGTFGNVWAAKELSTGRSVALKQIKLKGHSEGFPRTAIREIIIMKKHVHPNILSIEEVVWAQTEDDFDVYLVMDFYNYDLRRLLDKFQLKFNSSQVKYLFRQLAEGVAYLHNNILMHRDLKTENILINNTGHLKICDFGLARAFNPEGRMKTYTPVVITLWYRPPELLLGPCAYSCEVDQWSVGCIFAELVRSIVLFAGSDVIDQAERIFSIMGTPNDDTWPEYMDLPGVEKISSRIYPNRLRSIITPDILSAAGYDLLTKLLTYRPEDRITASETLKHPYFTEYPDPVTSIDIESMLKLASSGNNNSSPISILV